MTSMVLLLFCVCCFGVLFICCYYDRSTVVEGLLDLESREQRLASSFASFDNERTNERNTREKEIVKLQQVVQEIKDKEEALKKAIKKYDEKKKKFLDVKNKLAVDHNLKPLTNFLLFFTLFYYFDVLFFSFDKYVGSSCI